MSLPIPRVQVCSHLHIPLHVVPLTTEYWTHVVTSSIADIRRGRTPNPDVLCNSRVKFGAFVDYLTNNSDAFGRFDRIASGHYARILR